jgi:hypothetical protein
MNRHGVALGVVLALRQLAHLRVGHHGLGLIVGRVQRRGKACTFSTSGSSVDSSRARAPTCAPSAVSSRARSSSARRAAD